MPVANDGLSEKIEWYLNGMLLSPAVGIENLWRERKYGMKNWHQNSKFLLLDLAPSESLHYVSVPVLSPAHQVLSK